METLFTEDKLGELRDQLGLLNNDFEEYMTTHAKCQVLFKPEDREFDDTSGVDNLDRAVYAFRKRLKSWLSELENSRKEQSQKRKFNEHHQKLRQGHQGHLIPQRNPILQKVY